MLDGRRRRVIALLVDGQFGESGLMQPFAVASVLGDWTRGDGPAYRQLAMALGRVIARGHIAAGERLPAERRLAPALAVSRTTVVHALTLLRDEGVIESRQGSGWIVRGPLVAGRWNRVAPTSSSRFGRGGPIDLTLAPTAPLPMVEQELRRLVDRDLGMLAAHPGYSPAGLPALRASIAERLVASGVPTAPNEVVVTTGAQQAIALLAGLYLRPRDVVACEDATHPGALDVFRAAAAQVHPIGTDQHGLRVDELERLAGARPPRLVYLTPTFSTPTCTVLSTERRRRLARLAARLSMPVIEDVAPADLSLDAVTPPPPVAHFGTDGPILVVGSMSKLFWPGLRVGWIRAPRPVVTQLVRMKATADLGTPLLDQLLAARLLGRWEEAQEARRRHYAPARARFTDALERVLPTWSWRMPGGGFALWARLPRGDARAFAAVAVRHGVTVAPGPLFTPDERHTDRLFLEYTLPPRLLDEAVERLGRAWATYEPTVGG